ncbi:ABC transporter substrate-binding protein [Limnochorda pilosa]|uniref:ABC transporter substrate-binding protein n=1 Tax=Limnochorda pilosa TaxID=1555112 RepID=A0A0K2SJU6_LIMPI|nr:ABC transporter substrate-binding protein [Limnochorda pilosa]
MVRNGTRWARALAVGLALLSCLVVLGRSPVQAASIQVTDALGQNYEWNAPPQRIIALAPSITENLFAVGAGPQVVGVSAYSDYPSEAASLPVVSDATQVNLERLLELQPDLVVGDLQLVRAHLEDLKRLGVAVFAVDVPNLEALWEALLLLGQATGHEETARSLVAGLQQRVAAVQERTASIPPDQRPLVFVEVWNDPLMTAGPGSFIDELVTLAGGRNLAHEAPSAWPTYSPETVIARDPEVILLTHPNRGEVQARPGWQSVRAIRDGKVYELDPDSVTITGPRLVDGLEALARIFHPDR